MSENPFQAPQQNNPFGQPGYPPGQPQNYGRAYIQQVPVIAALMIVQGVLLIVFALLMFGYAYFFTQMDRFVPPEQRAEFQAQFQQQEGAIASIVFAALGVLVFLLSIMHFMAAYFGFTLRYRIFGIATLIMGLGSMLTCYCAPTAIGLAVYGMVIYFNPATAKAFELAKSGLTKQEILEQFPR